jgi:RNA polymerase sigma-70 factor (ECF subfamily)
MPHEAEVRRWLRKIPAAREDEADIIQEAYYRLWRLPDRSHIVAPRSYFFQTVRSILLERLRKDRVVAIESLAEIDVACIPSDEPDADRLVAGRSRLALVQALIEEMPHRWARIIQARRIDALSQRETAELLGVSENVVEKGVARGLRYLMRRIGELDGVAAPPEAGRSRKRRKPG